MKQGTEYARKIKRLFTRLKKEYGTPEVPEATDPIDQALFGILHHGTTVAKAEKALRAMNDAMVDRNELRVSSPAELIELMGPGFPHATRKAKAIGKVLTAVFARYDELSIEALRDKGKREGRKILEEMDGMDFAAAAGVMLFSLDGHAIPVDENTLAVLRAEDLVHPEADVEEVQAFLERNVSAANAKAFTVLLRRYAEDRYKQVVPKSGRKTTKKKATKSTKSKKTKAKKAKKATKRSTKAAGRTKKTKRAGGKRKKTSKKSTAKSR